MRHPLQPFDPRNFVADELMPGRVWSFDKVALDGARALIGPRKDAAPVPRPNRCRALDSPTIEIEDLVRFTAHPVKAFLRRRLGISLADPVGRGRRSAQHRARCPRADGASVSDCSRHALPASTSRRLSLPRSARGSLPPGVLGERVIEVVSPIVERIAAEAQSARPATGSSDSITSASTSPTGAC